VEDNTVAGLDLEVVRQIELTFVRWLQRQRIASVQTGLWPRGERARRFIKLVDLDADGDVVRRQRLCKSPRETDTAIVRSGNVCRRAGKNGVFRRVVAIDIQIVGVTEFLWLSIV